MSDTGPKRGLTLPFFLVLLLAFGVFGDLLLADYPFIVSAAYRQSQGWLVGAALLGFLLWLWLLSAARHRNERFNGPIQTVRGHTGLWQPLLGTVLLVIAGTYAYHAAVPRWLNALTSERAASVPFTLTADIAGWNAGCAMVPATSPDFGAVRLCLPAQVSESLRGSPVTQIAVGGPASWFGIEAQDFAPTGAARPTGNFTHGN